MAVPVKFYSSTMPGAPVLNGVAGSRIAVLSACLVDGWGLNALTSLSIAGGVMTCSLNNHPYVVGQAVQISGVTSPASANGVFIIETASANTFTCSAAGIGDQSATGAPTAKVAPAGWDRPFSGTNKAVYRPSASTSNKPCLRVLDTGAQLSRVAGYTSMTTVDAGSNIFPSAAQLSGGAYWPGSSSADATARPWIILADDRMFYFWRAPDGGSALATIDAFGEFASEKPGDAYNALLTGDESSTGVSYPSPIAVDGSGTASWAPREYTQSGAAVRLSGWVGHQAGVFYPFSGAGGVTYPSPVSGGLLLSRPAIAASAVAGLRCAAVPGLYHTPQNLPMAHGQLVSNVPGLPGRTLIAIETKTGVGPGRVFIDMTGPWR